VGYDFKTFTKKYDSSKDAIEGFSIGYLFAFQGREMI
jgi:hypothetical protein